ncbi:MAG TPA: GNAT family N-acetyltransferase [Pyrinomonadaceae bacterium]|jgi:GNAT superfamily N-acetyltransferase
MPDEIKIEQLQLSDRDKAIALVAKGYGDNPRMSDARFWDWHYREVPKMGMGKPPIWVAKSGERIVAQVATIPVEVNIESERRRAIWIVDMVVDPEFRRRGLAKKLVLAAEEFCPFGLVIGTNEQHSDPLLQSLGYRHVAKIPRFHKLLFPANDVRQIASLNLLRKAVNLAFAPFRPRFEKNKNVRAVEKFDASFDALWTEAETQWSCAVRRTAQFLEWQYARQPGKRFDVIGYYEGEKLLGYAVLFFRKPRANGAISKAAITDICYHPENPKKTVDALLQESLRLAVERGAGGLVTDVLDKLTEERLLHFGFGRVKSPLQFMVKSADRQDLLYNPEKWFVTRGDADVSIFEDPNL